MSTLCIYSTLLPGKLCSTFAVEIKVNNRFSLGIGFYLGKQITRGL